MAIDPGPTPVSQRTHPLHRFAGRAHQVLDEVGPAPAYTLTPDETVETLLELARLEARLAERKLAVLAHADQIDVATTLAATSIAAVLRSDLGLAPADARRQVTLARALDRPDHDPTRHALAAGRVTPGHAQVITTAVDTLPAAVGPDDRAKAEAHLLELAADHDVAELRVLARRLHHVVDPDAADARLAKELDKQERLADAKTFLTCYDTGKGYVEGAYRIPTLHGAQLRRMLHALTNPRRPEGGPAQGDGESDGDETASGRIDREGLTREELLGQAFCQLIGRYPLDRLPMTGGVNAHVVVTLPADTLAGGLQAAQLDTGQPLSPGLSRRLAAQAGLIPAVLGTGSEVLDLGRRARFHTPAQRLAMALQQDHVCAVDGCTIPAWMCEAAHQTPWVHAGRTSIREGYLLCPRHHRMHDRGTYTIDRLGPGRIRLNRRE